MRLKTSLGIGALILAANCHHAPEGKIETAEERGVTIAVPYGILIYGGIYPRLGTMSICDLNGDELIDLIDVQNYPHDYNCTGGIYRECPRIDTLIN